MWKFTFIDYICMHKAFVVYLVLFLEET